MPTTISNSLPSANAKFNAALRAAARTVAYLSGGASRVDACLLNSGASEWADVVRARQSIKGNLNLDVIECAGYVAELFAACRTVSAPEVYEAIQKQSKDLTARKYFLFPADSCTQTHITEALALVKRHWLTILGLAHHLESSTHQDAIVCHVEKRAANIYALCDARRHGAKS